MKCYRQLVIALNRHTTSHVRSVCTVRDGHGKNLVTSVGHDSGRMVQELWNKSSTCDSVRVRPLTCVGRTSLHAMENGMREGHASEWNFVSGLANLLGMNDSPVYVRH